ncbi:MAG: hypothetical protein AUG87_12525 [Candidatus Rokubacteria bacterium 13_1_20CM_4_70_14]|nr:MAG: hypothetical protein AUG87_12525 [Candidatus Rokubacteria bacterium 13_1_20CM_4_70_14]
MKAIAQRRETATLESLVDRVLCHDVRDAAGKVAVEKGARLTATSAATLLATPWDEIHVLAIEAGDLHEEDAGRRLAAAVVGDGVEVKGYGGGVTGRGVPPRARVEPRGRVVRAVERERLDEHLDRAAARETDLPRGAVAQERLDARQRARFEGALQQKAEWFGSRLLPVRFAGGAPRVIADELTALRRAGAEVLIVAGASALDPLDPVFGGLTLLGARMERHGAPAHPGSLLWLALWEGQLVLGMPTCGMFSQATTFDLVLPRILAGEHVDNRTIAELGHGGLLSRDMSYRFPPYRENAARGELE